MPASNVGRRLILMLISGLCLHIASAQAGRKELAALILNDRQLDTVSALAQKLAGTGLNAGDGYSGVWIRDVNTFIELACSDGNTGKIREGLLTFFKFQQTDGEVLDEYILQSKEEADNYHPYTSPLVPGYIGYKNNVETDQETSLIQAVSKYIKATGDTSFLNRKVTGLTVMERMEMAVRFLLRERWSEQYGLLWGATTADWGDVQPEHEWGVRLDDQSHKAIDIYDNAMLLIALKNYIHLATGLKQNTKEWERLIKRVESNVKKYLWDTASNKFIPHLYLAGSPFPAGFDENKIYYHGGTAIAIEAGLLSKQQIIQANKKMLANVQASGASSIGLSLYPAYPDTYFKNSMMKPYHYQNGGDWTWFGARMILQLAHNGFVKEAYAELRPMIERVCKGGDFHEWYRLTGEPAGSPCYKGTAGALWSAINFLKAWATKNK